jgi:cytochrome P450/NADPH-cytochrome P450 reductase
MNETVDRIVRERRQNGDGAGDKRDLLSYMLTGVDRKTGEGLDDLNIRYQIITFLIAGHETTSGLLSFAIYALLNNPHVLARAYEEVDRVLGPDPSRQPTYAQVNQLTYIGQILKETLRLWPTAPAFGLAAHKDTVLGGAYKMKRSYQIVVLVSALHRDPAIWGEDADTFDPDHFTREAERARPANAYKPFGNGQRACIGRQFAMQEAALVLGMILQRFELIDHTGYQLAIKESLTIKPDGFLIKLRRRPARHGGRATAPVVEATPSLETTPSAVMTAAPAARAGHGTPLLVLYGSNLGTAEGLARQIAEDGLAHGFAASVAPLDDYAGRLPTDGAVLIATASYNGTPPDNAMGFCDWLRGGALGPDALAGVRYAVFGCGNQDWASTYQAVPRLIDDALERHGAQRLCARGEGNARDDFDGQFQDWYKGVWPSVGAALGLDTARAAPAAKEPLYAVEIVPGHRASPFVASLGALPMTVRTNRELHRHDGPLPSDRSTRHIELDLPAGVTYRAGDHLGVIAHNSETLVRRVASRFGFETDVLVRLRRSGGRKSFLPVDEPISVYRLLADYVELQDVATRSQIRTLVEHTECPWTRPRLAALAGDDEASVARYKAEVMAPRKSLVDLLEEYPACGLPFHIYLEMLSPLAPRYYSISSSPLAGERHLSITVGVVDSPARSGRGTYQGVCSSYLCRQEDAGVVYAFVRDTKSAFRLPDDPTTPIIMVGPGTGLAPFRGFLQERAWLKQQGQRIGRSLLFFGCRHPEQDLLYADELRALEDAGVTEVKIAFSRLPGRQKTYVQDLIVAERDVVWALLEGGATVYVCGDASRMAPDVRRAFAGIHAEKTGHGDAAAAQWLDELAARQRYLVDVWAAS